MFHMRGSKIQEQESTQGQEAHTASPPSPVMDTDSNDSLVKCVEASLSLPAPSPLSSQMQKHLLSSTMQHPTRLQTHTTRSISPPFPPTCSISPPFPPTCSISPPSPTTSTFSPSQSASPLPSLPDLNFAMDSGKLPQFTLGSQSGTGFDDIVEPLHNKKIYQPLPLNNSVGDIPPFNVSTASRPKAESSGVKLLLVDSAQTLATHPSTSLALLNPLPPLPSSSLTLLNPLPSVPTNSLGILNPVSSLTRNTLPMLNPLDVQPPLTSVSCTSSTMHPRKKRRLLTFLSEQNSSKPSEQQPTILLTAEQQQPPDQFLGFSPGKALICSKSNQSVVLKQQAITSGGEVLMTNPQEQPASLFLQPCTKQDQSAATLIINSGQQQSQADSSQSTLIFNSAGTAATLITPVATVSTSIYPATSNLELSAPRNDPTTYSTYSMGQAPSVNLVSLDCPNPLIPPVPTLSDRLSNYFTPLTCYKCKLCGYISLFKDGLKNHLLDDHEDLFRGEEEEAGEEALLTTAIRAGMKLMCPLCPNLFSSGRSFKVHVVEDHGLEESTAEQELQTRNQDRRKQALQLLRKERVEAREERRRMRQNRYEAYVDDDNELKVRLPRSANLDSPIKAVCSGQFDVNSDEEIDVIRDDKGMIADEYLSLASESDDKLSGTLLKRKKVGRPRGSTTTVLASLRKFNPATRVRDEVMGEECGVQECAVRLKEAENLRLHREAHRSPGPGYSCPLTCEVTSLGWPAMAVHLWREHSRDLELIKCPSCSFRTTSRARLTRHQVSHTDTRPPWLCPKCGQAFKLAKQLAAHTATHTQDKVEDSSLSCHLCQAKFTLSRHLKLHIDSVHNKMKPFLCSYCGYSASSKSGLKLHLRKHTGDKPFRCQECNYNTADHNSLRRHRMRHTGVRPYKCPHCPYSSIQSSTYKIHLKTKHSVADVSSLLFQCTICLFKTLKESIFLAHISQHRSEDSQKKEESIFLAHISQPRSEDSQKKEESPVS